MREHLNDVAPRRMAVLDPVKLVIDDYPEGKEELMDVPNHPQKPDWGKRQVPFSRELWIEREDFQEQPEKGYFRLFPGNVVRLRYGYVVKCIGKKDGVVHCTHHPDSRSAQPGAENTGEGQHPWVRARHAYAAKVRLYDRPVQVARARQGPRLPAGHQPGLRKLVEAPSNPPARHPITPVSTSSSATDTSSATTTAHFQRTVTCAILESALVTAVRLLPGAVPPAFVRARREDLARTKLGKLLLVRQRLQHDRRLRRRAVRERMRRSLGLRRCGAGDQSKDEPRTHGAAIITR